MAPGPSASGLGIYRDRKLGLPSTVAEFEASYYDFSIITSRCERSEERHGSFPMKGPALLLLLSRIGQASLQIPGPESRDASEIHVKVTFLMKTASVLVIIDDAMSTPA